MTKLEVLRLELRTLDEIIFWYQSNVNGIKHSDTAESVNDILNTMEEQKSQVLRSIAKLFN